MSSPIVDRAIPPKFAQPARTKPRSPNRPKMEILAEKEARLRARVQRSNLEPLPVGRERADALLRAKVLRKRHPEAVRIIENVAWRNGVTSAELSTATNMVELVEARCEAIRALRKIGLPVITIAALIGVHHTTATYHLHKCACGPRRTRRKAGKWDRGVADLSGEWAI